MKLSIFLFVFACFVSTHGQVINLQSYIKSSKSNPIHIAISDIRKNYSSKKKPVTLFIPSGTYLLIINFIFYILITFPLKSLSILNGIVLFIR